MAVEPVLFNATDEEIDAMTDYSDIEQKYRPELKFPLAAAILLDGAPIVGRDREQRLIGAIKKLFDTRGFGPIEDIFMPFNEEGQSKGLLFIVLKDPVTAQHAAASLDGHPFDKRHTFVAKTFDEVERLQSVSEEFTDPPVQQYREREHLKSWLADPQSRDQVALLRGDDLQINWVNKNGSLSLAYDKPKEKSWTETYVQWSTQGSYLATVHAQGIAIWGGASFERINRFAHAKPSLIHFSPKEKYVVTWSQKPIEIPPGALNNPNFPFTEDDEGNQICVWEILTGRLMRSFPYVVPSDEEGKKHTFSWPLLKWSDDERYFARVQPGVQISVYETPSFGLLQKKSIKIEGVVDFEWCPLSEKDFEQDVAREAAIQSGAKTIPPQRENSLAYWVPEISNQPARVTLLSIPSRTPLRSKNLVNVSDCKIHWQSTGDYLCVKVDRHTKTKKTMFCNLDIFRVREKGLPVETIDIRDTVIAFAWEPKGDRFVLITSNDPNATTAAPGATLKTTISFYQLDTRKGDFRLLRSFDGKSANNVFWSPKGRHVITATLGSSTKFDVEFWDVDLEGRQEVGGPQKETTDLAAGIHLLASIERYGMTAIEWDPSGRFVTIAGTIWQSSMEPAYSIHTFAGAEITRSPADKLKMIMWRPRPVTLLSRAEQKKIRKNLREYSRQFDEQDAAEESNVSKELLDQRKRLVDEWNAWRKKVTAQVASEREALGRKPPGKMPVKATATETVEEWLEEVISETEEVVTGDE